MLTARGHKTMGPAAFHFAYAFSRRVWARIVHGHGFAFDSRFMPGAPGGSKPSVCLYLVLAGSWRGFAPAGPRVAGRGAIALTHEQLEGAYGRRSFNFRSAGEPFNAIELNFSASDLSLSSLPAMPGLVDLDDRAWTAASRAAALSSNDEHELVDGLCELLRSLVALGLLAEEAAEKALTVPRPVVRLWRAVQPMVERLTLSPTLDDMSGATGLSVSQVEREMQRLVGIFGLVGPGLRNVTHHLRLKVAVLFLSADGVSIGEVARAVGYGSVDAMARAFRLAGIAAPSVIQQELIAARTEDSSTADGAPRL